jgi:hypothetical protein
MRRGCGEVGCVCAGCGEAFFFPLSSARRRGTTAEEGHAVMNPRTETRGTKKERRRGRPVLAVRTRKCISLVTLTKRVL